MNVEHTYQTSIANNWDVFATAREIRDTKGVDFAVEYLVDWFNKTYPSLTSGQIDEIGEMCFNGLT